MQEPLWIELKAVLAAHDAQIAHYGGLAGVRDMNLLESALAKPRQTFFYAEPAPDLYELAALYTTGIARNHPFHDANKRTAFVTGLGFLGLNGKPLHLARDHFAEAVGIMVSVAQGQTDAIALAAWMREHAR